MGAEISIDKNIKVRSMEPDDICGILEIDRKVSGMRRAETYKDRLTSDLGGELDLSFVAELDNRITGFILARRVYLGDPAEEIGLIQIMGVDPDYKRIGIGSMMIEKLISHCREKGAKMIKIMVNEYDSDLGEFFIHIGFKRGPLIEYAIDC
jgi:predicted N-acetyltransferase YhbS